jgi:hypothetical protein
VNPLLGTYKKQDTVFERRPTPGPAGAGHRSVTYIDASAVLHLCRAVPRRTLLPEQETSSQKRHA